jgi:hypothetical protein
MPRLESTTLQIPAGTSFPLGWPKHPQRAEMDLQKGLDPRDHQQGQFLDQKRFLDNDRLVSIENNANSRRQLRIEN